MTFFERLETSTARERAALAGSPIVADALAGNVTREQYLEFLTRAFHHVRHTPSLLMACGARLADDREWLRAEVAEYAQEEIGHHEWILNDIAAAGGDAEAVRASAPELNTELLVAYAYDTIMRRNPVGFFGMVYVLEGTSIRLATEVAQSVQNALHLPSNAFTYLMSHGALDIEHMGHFERLMNRLDREEDRVAVEHCAKVCFRLYTNVLTGIEAKEAA
jgi:pyrroloquinoline quinone (PQQ) biosynthesis protein C